MIDKVVRDLTKIPKTSKTTAPGANNVKVNDIRRFFGTLESSRWKLCR